MNNNNLTLRSLKTKINIENMFVLSLAISPLFLLTVTGWMTHIIAVCALLAFLVLSKNKIKGNELIAPEKFTFATKLLSLTFALPLIAILLSQAFRGQFSAPYYDSPAHIMLCIMILLAILKTNPRVVELMSYCFPLVTLLALGSILIHPNLHWGIDRLSTQAVDPLELGSLSLTFALLSLFSIKLHNSNSRLLLLFKLIGFCAGVYLSIVSGSRTGWLALPIVVFLWLYYDLKRFTLPTKTIVAIAITTVLISSYFLSSNVHQRIDNVSKDILSYKWNTDNPSDYTSVGARISFARMAIFLLEQKPLSGWGDGGFKSVINDPALKFSQIETKTIALEAGFHNDITANMVRSGIWGLISTVALFLVPAIFFISNLRATHKAQRDVAFIALIFLICQFISSLSMEILNLRYSASFFGLMLAVFCGQLLFFTANSNSKTL